MQSFKYLFVFLVLGLPYVHCIDSTNHIELSYEEIVQSLIDRNPFNNPFNIQIEAAPSSDDSSKEEEEDYVVNKNYALNSIVKRNNAGIYDFSIVNKLTGKSYWISSGRSVQPNNHSVQYHSFDKINKVLVLQTYDGLKRIPLVQPHYIQRGTSLGNRYYDNYSSGNVYDDDDDDDDDDDSIFSSASKSVSKGKDALARYREELEKNKNSSYE